MSNRCYKLLPVLISLFIFCCACTKNSDPAVSVPSSDKLAALDTAAAAPATAPSPTLSCTPTVTPTPAPTATPTPVPAPNIPDIPQTGMSVRLPEGYLEPAAEAGSVDHFFYPSRDFAGDGEEIIKTANVYLPASYSPEDEDTRYNIFYMMHGFGLNADAFFGANDEIEKNLIDNMIANGDLPPMIIVAATYDAENLPADFNRSLEEVRAFHEDFVQYLMPAVESKYHTFARSVSADDLMASRDHRAFGGFSLGSVATWFEFCYDTDYIRYFLPISSACWYYGDSRNPMPVQNTELLSSVVKEKELIRRGFYIYACSGTIDSMRLETELQMNEMFKHSDIFDSRHAVFYLNEGAAHELVALPEYFYNALPLFFPPEKKDP